MKLKSIYVARLTDKYVETATDKNLIEDIERNLDECEATYDKMLFAMQNLLDDQEAAKNEQRVTHISNRNTISHWAN